MRTPFTDTKTDPTHGRLGTLLLLVPAVVDTADISNNLRHKSTAAGVLHQGGRGDQWFLEYRAR